MDCSWNYLFPLLYICQLIIVQILQFLSSFCPMILHVLLVFFIHTLLTFDFVLVCELFCSTRFIVFCKSFDSCPFLLFHVPLTFILCWLVIYLLPSVLFLFHLIRCVKLLFQLSFGICPLLLFAFIFFPLFHFSVLLHSKNFSRFFVFSFFRFLNVWSTFAFVNSFFFRFLNVYFQTFVHSLFNKIYKRSRVLTSIQLSRRGDSPLWERGHLWHNWF